MRAFHCAWISFFMAFFLWFSPSALLPEIELSLNLNHEQIWLSTICSDISTILMRFILGPICDWYGARIPMGIVLGLAAIPTALIGVVNSLGGLCTARFFIGMVGSSFVMAQSWTSQTFAKELVGSANAIVAGWGNTGGAAAQLLMGAVLFPAFRSAYDGDVEKAWRTIFVFPAILAIIVGVVIVRISNDHPRGNYSEMKKEGTMDIAALNDAFRTNAANRNALLLSIQYACCFGVEITTNNAAPLYFKDTFGRSTASAAALASIFGFMNVFARPAGGILSDKINSRFGKLS
jgi:NNP family nitrate/nitrite transporter-like MFS transporter